MCACRWARVKKLKVGSAVVSGDVLVEKCPYHRWFSSLSSEDARRVSEMERRGVPPEARPTLLAARKMDS